MQGAGKGLSEWKEAASSVGAESKPCCARLALLSAELKFQVIKPLLLEIIQEKCMANNFSCPVDLNPLSTQLCPAAAVMCLIWLSAAARSSSALMPLELQGTVVA